MDEGWAEYLDDFEVDSSPSAGELKFSELWEDPKVEDVNPWDLMAVEQGKAPDLAKLLPDPKWVKVALEEGSRIREADLHPGEYGEDADRPESSREWHEPFKERSMEQLLLTKEPFRVVTSYRMIASDMFAVETSIVRQRTRPPFLWREKGGRICKWADVVHNADPPDDQTVVWDSEELTVPAKPVPMSRKKRKKEFLRFLRSYGDPYG